VAILRAQLVISVVLLFALLVVGGCKRQDRGLSGDVAIESKAMPGMKGKLYLRGNKIRIDWDSMTDVFDTRSRKGWRLFRDSKAYWELGSKDLSTVLPEQENGSLCPRATVPSGCRFVGNEVLLGRSVKKWDLYQPDKGFHSYFWTDDATGIALRMEIEGAASYEVKNLSRASVPESMFDFPSGYQRMDPLVRP
jgi:hypothetical protein